MRIGTNANTTTTPVALPVGKPDGPSKREAANFAEVELSTPLPELIPDGEYEVVYVRHDFAHVFKTPKVFVWFRIVTPGTYFGVELFRAFRLQSFDRGRIKIGRGSELARWLASAADTSFRRDRVPLTSLKGIVLKVTVRTVIRDYRRESPPSMRYSVIEDIVGAVTGK